MTIIQGCKKKKPEPEPAAPAAPTIPVSATYYGWCIATNQFIVNSSNFQETQNGSYVIAFFTSNAISDTTSLNNYVYNSTGTVVVGTSDTLTNPTNSSSFIKMTSAPWSAPYNWIYSGNSTVSSFTTTSNLPFPTWNQYSQIPITFSKNSGFSFTLNGLVNVNHVIAFLSDGMAHSSRVEVNTSGSTCFISFPANQTNSFQTGNTSFLEITLYNVEYKSFNAKSIKFSNAKFFLINGLTAN